MIWSELARFKEHGTGETGFVLEILRWEPVVSQTIPGGGPYVYTPAAPTLATLWAIVLRDATKTTDVIQLSTFDIMF